MINEYQADCFAPVRKQVAHHLTFLSDWPEAEYSLCNRNCRETWYNLNGVIVIACRLTRRCFLIKTKADYDCLKSTELDGPLSVKSRLERTCSKLIADYCLNHQCCWHAAVPNSNCWEFAVVSLPQLSEEPNSDLSTIRYSLAHLQINCWTLYG